jgi:hypothetical protein
MTTRRDTLAWLMRALALSAARPAAAWAGTGAPAALGPEPSLGYGYGKDPDLRHPVRPWPLTLDKDQTRAVARLADLILPADEHSPSASAVGVPAFVDEWVSAPYPAQQADRARVLAGLAWLDQAAGGRFADLPDDRAGAILDRICDPATAQDPEAAAFFHRFKSICMLGFYTTPEGWADLGYVGNKPSAAFPDPPPEVLARLKI